HGRIALLRLAYHGAPRLPWSGDRAHHRVAASHERIARESHLDLSDFPDVSRRTSLVDVWFSSDRGSQARRTMAHHVDERINWSLLYRDFFVSSRPLIRRFAPPSRPLSHRERVARSAG